MTEQHLLRGNLQEAQQSLERISTDADYAAATFRGWLNFLRGDNLKALECYTAALKLLRKVTGKRQIYFNNIGGLFFILALLKDNSPECLREAQTYTKIATRQSDYRFKSIYICLQKVLEIQQGDLSQKESIVNASTALKGKYYSLEMLFSALCLYWVDKDSAKGQLPKILGPLYEQAAAAGYAWIAMETAELLSRLQPQNSYGNLRQACDIPALVDLIQAQEPWELCLNALANLHQEPSAQTEGNQRLAWFITFHTEHWTLQPREQTMNAKGIWSLGRNIALKRLSKESPTRLKVIEIKAEHRRIAEIIGKRNRLEVPAKAKERVLAAIDAVCGIVTVHSDIGGGLEQTVSAETKPYLHLLPAREGLKVSLLSHPFAHGGPYFRPGVGGETVIAEIDHKRLQTTRNLREEKTRAQAVLAACPTLA
nr:hypothetical protein [Anthocerotibacter panamensis]